MATISATFKNDYGDSRKWTIWDTGIDPNAPKVVFDDYLASGNSTSTLTLQQDEGGTQGHAQYKRSDGAINSVDVSDGSVVSMN